MTSATIPEALSVMADLYNPVLGVGILQVMIRLRHRRFINLAAATLALYLVGVFGVMGVDLSMRLWPMAGMDYSTHTAFAAACVWFLWRHQQHRPVLSLGWILSLMLYLWLMHHLQYHSIADMASSLLAIFIWMILMDRMMNRFRSGNSSSSQNPECSRSPDPDHRV